MFFLSLRAFFVFLSLQMILFNANAKMEKFLFDEYHTNVTWSADHFGFSRPNGKFTKVTGFIMLDEQNPKTSSVNLTIDTSSIITGIPSFDKHLKSEDFFNVRKFQNATFESTKVKVYRGNRAKIYGNFTLLGITKPIILEAKVNKIGVHPFTNKRTVGLSGETTIKRSEFGMVYALGGVSDDVKIQFEIEAFVE